MSLNCEQKCEHFEKKLRNVAASLQANNTEVKPREGRRARPCFVFVVGVWVHIETLPGKLILVKRGDT